VAGFVALAAGLAAGALLSRQAIRPASNRALRHVA
jgi:hypothetical protein